MHAQPPPRQTPPDFFGHAPESPAGPEHAAHATPHDSPAYTGNEPQGALVSIHAAALQANAESFPVLKAFQDYLEAERQRARKRMVMLSAVFLSTLLIVVIGMLVAGLALFRHFAQNAQQMQNVLVDVALRPRQTAADMGEASARATEDLAAAIQSRMQNIDALAATMTTQQTSQTMEFTALRTSMQEVLDRNQSLREELESVRAEIPILASNIAQRVATAPPIHPEPVPSPDRPEPAFPPAPRHPADAPLASHGAPAPEGYFETTVFLVPPGVSEPVEWKLIIPE